MEGKVVNDDVIFDAVKDFLAAGKTVELVPKGNSMLPFIRQGKDSVVLDRPSEKLEVGDILLVCMHGNYVMHRLFEIDGDKLTLMGDGNLAGKEHCLRSDVIAVVKEILRNGALEKEGSKVRKVQPGKGRLWRMLLPFRRYLLAIYRRVFL